MKEVSSSSSSSIFLFNTIVPLYCSIFLIIVNITFSTEMNRLQRLANKCSDFNPWLENSSY